MPLINKFLIFLFLTSFSSSLLAVIVNADRQSNVSLKDTAAQATDFFLFEKDDSYDELKQVIVLFEAGKKLKAKKMILDILTKTPTEPRALHIAGIIFMEEGRYENAQVALEVALRGDIKNPAIISKLGVVRLLQGNQDKSKKLLEYALKLEPGNPLALRYLAWIAEKNGQYNQAITYYQKLLDRPAQTELAEAHLSLARLYVKTNNHNYVVKLLSAFIDNDSSLDNSVKKVAAILLIESMIQAGDYKKAEVLLKNSVTNKAIDALQLSVFKIELLIKQKEYKQFKRVIKEEIIKQPEKEYVLRYTAAKAFTSEQEYNRAIKQMTRVIAILDKGKKLNELFSVINDVTAVYIKAGRKIDALRLVQKYVDKYPDNSQLIYQLAELQIASGQLEEAEKNLDKLLILEPDFYAVYYLKGLIARRQKDYEQAEKWLAKINKLQPDNVQAWIQRSGSAYQSGDQAAAIKIIADAVKANKTNMTLWFEYGALLTETERHKEAVIAYKQVLGVYPDHLPSLDNLAGSLLVLENNPAEALYYAGRAYKMEPSDKVLQLNYLEAILLNKQYTKLLSKAEQLRTELDSFGKYHYYIGVAQIQLGDSQKGSEQLQQALKDASLDKRIKDKTVKLLESL